MAKRPVDFHMEQLTSKIWRAKVPGGWLVFHTGSSGDAMVFYPDPHHVWTGATLP